MRFTWVAIEECTRCRGVEQETFMSPSEASAALEQLRRMDEDRWLGLVERGVLRDVQRPPEPEEQRP